VLFDLRRTAGRQDRLTACDVIHAGCRIRIFGC
jgi:hypothetical protein